jgi:hypothetical protein
MREAEPTAINDDKVDANVVLKLDSWCLIPAAKKQQPRTWGYQLSRIVEMGQYTYKEHVGQYTPKHARLHNSNFLVLECNNIHLHNRYLLALSDTRPTLTHN